MADKQAQSECNVAKRSQLASFSIQDILSNDLHTAKRRANDAATRKKPDGKMAKTVSETGKRIRTIFTQEQLDKLEASFERQQYMIRSERSQLAAALNLQEAQVKVWVSLRES